MKKTIAIALTLALCAMFTTAALAETPAQTAEPTAVVETATESVVDSFLSEIENTWNTITGTVTDGFSVVTGTVEQWAQTVESYFTEKGSAISGEAQAAWTILQEGATEKGKIAQNQAEEAYRTLRAWFEQAGDAVDQGVAAAIDATAGAAGVIEAQVSGWYRTVEAFIVDSSETVSETVLQAWTTIREESVHMGTVAADQLAEAYNTVREWLQSFDTEEAAQASEALDNIVNQAQE